MRYIVLGLIMAGLFQVFFWLTQDNLITLKEDSFEKIESLSYSPYEGYNKNLLSKQQIYDDVTMLENFTNKLRTYATLEANAVLEATPDSNMPIDLGLWISGDHEQNHLEIKRAIKLLEKYPNRINSVIVGNEVLLRADLDEVELFAYVDFMRQFTKKPITVAETWDVWERVPDLAKHVDFLTIHILPYWEKIPIDRFNEFIIEKYSLVEKIHPNRKIVIGETGWPSHGYNNRSAVPSLKNQAMAIRGFVNLANEHGWHYNIIEAFDQQWKGYDEGNVGQYWGIFTSDRALKFQLNGDIELNQYWLYQMIVATILGAIITLLGLRNQRVNISHALAYAVTAQGMAFGIVMAAIYPFINYMNFGMWVMWGMGTFLMIPLVIITLAKANELFRSSIGVPPSRLVPLDLKSQNAPLVSIHVPAYKEEPHVLEETLRSLSQLKYPNYEVLVIINNTPEEYYWKPIEKLCEELGDKFVFM
ncbi:glycosyl hydrolase family 17 protein, partial [Aliarcobacter butzleri]